jgi:hypothetical protein
MKMQDVREVIKELYSCGESLPYALFESYLLDQFLQARGD